MIDYYCIYISYTWTKVINSEPLFCISSALEALVLILQQVFDHLGFIPELWFYLGLGVA